MAEPRTRKELEAYLSRRRDYFEKPSPDSGRQPQPEPPLSAREYLMVQRLTNARPPYSIT
jgi:hypothetical protein